MRILKSSLLGLLCIPALLAAPVSAQLPVSLSGGDKPTLAPLLKQITPAVVSIVVETKVEPQQQIPDFLFQSPFGDLPFSAPPDQGDQTQKGAGSGVIIDAKQGYILTNNHVVENAESIEVYLSDGRDYPADVVGTDPGTDIALIKIDADNLHQIEIGDSEKLQVGDFVLAIGNPFDLGETVTSGIVSALGRGMSADPQSDNVYEDFIQTDAAINPGNSGGALVDLDGKLVGINTAIVTPARGNVGIGFAVPTAMAMRVVDQLLEFGDVERGLLGVTVQTLTPALAESLGVNLDHGAIVTTVNDGSAAQRAGIEADDIIVSLNDKPVDSSSDLRNRIALTRPGTDVTLGVMRGNKTLNIRATVGARSNEAVSSSSTAPSSGGGQVPRLGGAQFGEIPRDNPSYGTVTGVYVTSVAPRSEAERANLEAGDIITAVGRQSVETVGELADAMRSAQGRPVALIIRRNGARLYLPVR